MGSVLPCPHPVIVGVARHVFVFLSLRIKRWVIRLQRIYNFLLFRALILSVLDVLYALICYFILFLGLTY